MFAIIKKYFEKGLYNETQVYTFYKAKLITHEQYLSLVGANNE